MRGFARRIGFGRPGDIEIVALAALLSGKLPVKGKTVGVVLTGGNIDPQMLMRALEA